MREESLLGDVQGLRAVGIRRPTLPERKILFVGIVPRASVV